MPEAEVEVHRDPVAQDGTVGLRERPSELGVPTEGVKLMEPIEVEARRLISGPRRDDYGAVREGFEKAAGMWSKILGITVTAEQACMCMIAWKLYRESMSHKRDNLVDLVGYTLLLAQLEQEEEER